MKKRKVQIEVNGVSKYVGDIIGDRPEDACFSYAESYLQDSKSSAISISLPMEKKIFDATSTRNFFEGLLPEGFTRRCVANWMNTDEADYLSILSGLGQECLGAIKIVDDEMETVAAEYRKLSGEQVKKLAQEGATESAELVTKAHLSLTGASGKVGLYYDSLNSQWYLPIGDAPSTHIVKQSHVRLKRIVVNEQLCLITAKNLGIEIPESFIVKTESDEEEDILFATKRYDRKFIQNSKKLNGLNVPLRLHQEDFSQALGIPASEKYEKNGAGYLKRMFDILRNYSEDPLSDQMKLWDICVFNYLIGNTDNHIKNVSLLYKEDLKTVRLAPAYDIVSTMIYGQSTENMAIGIAGKYRISDITKKDFEEEAKVIGIGTKVAMKRFEAMLAKFSLALRSAKNTLEEHGFDEADSVYKQILQRGGIKSYLK